MSDLNGNNDKPSDNSGLLSGSYFTEEQLAEELRVCVRTVHRWINLGEAPPYLKVGRRRYFRREAVEKWLKSRERAAVA